MLTISYRQAKRLARRYRAEGATGLRHRSAGRPSNRARAQTERVQALALIREKYSGTPGERFGPTLAAEHLASEDGVVVDHETWRRWMLAEELWSRRRTRSPHRRRRERMAHFGELVQLDGSFHPWFERRGPQSCLLTLVDDATGRSFGRFGAQETIWAAVGVLRRWIETFGIPRALYTDWKNVYVRKPTVEERFTGAEPLTQFGRMCATLGITIIPASSPQAKGRIERHHGTHQDRLVKKLRRAGIASWDAANAFLEAAYWDEHNRRFAQAPASSEDFHLAVPDACRSMRYFDSSRCGPCRMTGSCATPIAICRLSARPPSRPPAGSSRFSRMPRGGSTSAIAAGACGGRSWGRPRRPPSRHAAPRRHGPRPRPR